MRVNNFFWGAEATPIIYWVSLNYVTPKITIPIGKNPLGGGFLNVDEPRWSVGWWRRRESNPRPQALYRQFYILSTII